MGYPIFPHMFPVMFDKTAAVPMTLPVGVKMGPQVEEDPDVVLTGRDMEVGDTDVGRDIRVLTDVCPMMVDESATEPLSLPVVVNEETQVDVRWDTTLAVVPFVDGCGRPAGWLDYESDCCVMDEIVLVPEMSPIISMRSVAVPTFLPAMSEVFSLAVLTGGSLLRLFLRLVGIGISDGQCGVRGTQRIVRVRGCSDLLAFRPRLWKSGLKMTLRD